jgi:hypothetical protein
VEKLIAQELNKQDQKLAQEYQEAAKDKNLFTFLLQELYFNFLILMMLHNHSSPNVHAC